ncbi:hypothetical protein AgCh_000203 [Apium graveolens]
MSSHRTPVPDLPLAREPELVGAVTEATESASVMSPLIGKLLKHSQQPLAFSPGLGDGISLLTGENLKDCGFVSKGHSADKVGTSHMIEMASGIPSGIKKIIRF